jgi:hypothetical protein
LFERNALRLALARDTELNDKMEIISRGPHGTRKSFRLLPLPFARSHKQCLKIQQDLCILFELAHRWDIAAVIIVATAVRGLGDSSPNAGVIVLDDRCVRVQPVSNPPQALIVRDQETAKCSALAD